MDEKQIAAEATGVAVALGTGYKVLRWMFPNKNGSEPSLRITIRQMLCTMDKKLDDILGRLNGHDKRLETLDGRTYEVQKQLSHHIDEEILVQDEMDRKLGCLMQQKGE